MLRLIGRHAGDSLWPSLLGLVTILLYGGIAGANPPVVRAMLMASMWLLHTTFFATGSKQQDLWSACWLMLLLAPSWLFSASFQLSFLAMWILLYWCPLWPVSCPARLSKPVQQTWRFVQQTVLTTIGTIWWSLPLVLHWNGLQPLLAPLANLLVLPCCTLLLLPWLLLSMALWLWLPLPGWYVHLLEQSWLFLLAAVDGLAQLPVLSTYRVDHLPSWLYPAWLLVATFPYWRALSWRCYGLAIAASLLGPTCHLLDKLQQLPLLAVHMLDVGQGQAMLIHGRNLPVSQQPPTLLEQLGAAGRDIVIVIDGGGSSPRWNSGQMVLLPMLRHLGIEHIDLLVATHGHQDHIGGLEPLLQHLSIGDVWAPANLGGTPLGAAFVAQVQNHAIAMTTVSATSPPWQQGDLRLQVLAPSSSSQQQSANAACLVLSLRYGCFHALLLADATQASEVAWQQQDLGPVVLLQVAHHGSRTGTSAALLQQSRPKLAWMSLQAGNRYGFPHHEVLNRLARVPEVWRTDLQGMLSLFTNGEAWWAQGMIYGHMPQQRMDCR